MDFRPQTEIERLATYSVARFRANPKKGLPIAIREELRHQGREELYDGVLAECRRRSQIRLRAKKGILKRTATSAPRPPTVPSPVVVSSKPQTKAMITPFLPGMEPTTPKYRLT